MTKKVLLVSDGLSPSYPDAELHLLALGFGASLAEGNFRPIDAVSIAEGSSQRVREFIPHFIYEFPKKKILYGNRSILDILRRKDINFWWFNKMAEKGALWSHLIKQLYYFDLIITSCEQNKYDELWIECKDHALVELIKRNQGKLPKIKVNKGLGARDPSTSSFGKLRTSLRAGWGLGGKRRLFLLALFVNNFHALLSTTAKTGILRRSVKHKVSGQREAAIAFFSFFPLFWSRDGKKESFFRTAPQKMAETGPVIFLTWFSMSIRQLLKNRKATLSDKEIPERVPLEAFITLKGYIQVFSSVTSYLFKAAKVHLLSKAIREEYRGFDISNIVKDELDRALSGHETAVCFLIKKAFEEYTSKYALKTVIFRAEFQPHERALVIAARGRCLSVAYQHQAIGRNFLQYFFPEQEISGSYAVRNNPDVQPVADKYLVAGKYPYNVLRSSGFREEDIRIAGPVRYSGLVRYLKSAKSRSELRRKYGYSPDQKLILVTPPAAKGEVLNFALTLAMAAAGIKGGIKYLFKSHPVFKYNDEIEAVIKEYCQGMDRVYLDDDVNLNEYLTMSDCLVLSGTTVGIEAICLGTMPVLLDNPNIFSLNPLTEIKDSLFWVNDRESLRRAIISAIDNGKECEAIRSNWNRAIENIFYNVHDDPDERFLQIMLEWLTRTGA